MILIPGPFPTLNYLSGMEKRLYSCMNQKSPRNPDELEEKDRQVLRIAGVMRKNNLLYIGN